ncbi:MAG: PQQ-dependent sugar dehydrogenase [Anaerolineales bacterium]|nr:PQQ-dependent sugar dehydrogenase [Anaerolineales bacterium]
MMKWRRGLSFLVVLLLAACGRTGDVAPTVMPAQNDLQMPAGYHAEQAWEGLQGPTQMIWGPDGWLWLAQLNGPENAGTGQIIALSLPDGQQRLLLDNLFKPTGLAFLDGALWIAAGNTLLRAPLSPDGRLEPPQTILADLPYNSRSNGTLTVTPDGFLIYETSGSRQGNQPRPGSATLWRLDPAHPDRPQPIATGLKGAYAHTFDAAGRLWITEIGDDKVNGTAPPDELNLVVMGADFGWPACFGFQEVAENFGGTPTQCAQTRSPVALFPAAATPTGVLASPWEPDTLLVALWVRGEVVRVPVRYDGDNARGESLPFISGLDHPQHLLPLPDGGLLLSDYGRGRLYRITRD